jgi:hypothetical protein
MLAVVDTGLRHRVPQTACVRIGDARTKRPNRQWHRLSLMKNMPLSRLRYALLLFLWSIPSTTVALETIDVGGQRLVIPAPVGFAVVPADMGELSQLLDRVVAPGNTRYMTFIPQAEITAARTGQRPRVERRFSVQTAQRLEQSVLSREEFAQMKEILRELNADVVAAVARHIPSFMEKATQGATDQLDASAGLEVTDMIVLPPHAESEQALAYSLFVKGETPRGDTQEHEFISAGTVAIIHVKGKVVFLYCYGGEHDLSWTRTMSQAWTAAVLAANRSDTRMLAQ